MKPNFQAIAIQSNLIFAKQSLSILIIDQTLPSLMFASGIVHQYKDQVGLGDGTAAPTADAAYLQYICKFDYNIHGPRLCRRD